MDLGAVLKAHGVACTAQREAIWRFFAGQPAGLTLPEAVAALGRWAIGQATVYRAVDLFARLGLLDHVQGTDGKVRYVARCPGHSHALICRGCHAAVEFEGCDLSPLERHLAARTGFSIQGHHLEMYGLCPACARAEA